MNRMFRAGLLALPFLLAAGPSATANPPGGGLAGTRWGCYQHGCGGFCLMRFPHMHAHGPLVNYGPYAGYYPFAPYGPWDENLNYHPPGNCGRDGCGRCGGRLAGLFHRPKGCDDGNCGGWGGYSRAVFKNVGHRVNPFAGGLPSCSTCSH